MDARSMIDVALYQAALEEVMREILHLQERKAELEGLIGKCSVNSPAINSAPKQPLSFIRPTSLRGAVLGFFEARPDEWFSPKQVDKALCPPNRKHLNPELSYLYCQGKLIRNDGLYRFITQPDITVSVTETSEPKTLIGKIEAFFKAHPGQWFAHKQVTTKLNVQRNVGPELKVLERRG